MREADSIFFRAAQLVLLTAIASSAVSIAINLGQPTDYSELPYVLCQGVIADNNIEFHIEYLLWVFGMYELISVGFKIFPSL